MTAPPEDDQGSSLAAMITAVRGGNPLTDLEHARLGLELLTRAHELGASWAQIGATLGITGREAKAGAHKLREAVKVGRIAAQDSKSAATETDYRR